MTEADHMGGDHHSLADYEGPWPEARPTARRRGPHRNSEAKAAAALPATHVTRTCSELWRKPLGTFGAEDLRVMINQGLGLRHLVPRAVDLLEADPLAEGDYFPGDLLLAVLRVDSTFWNERPDLRGRVGNCVKVAIRVGSLVPELAQAGEGFLSDGGLTMQ
jgi:hypothetical protein